jgi:hypothetical protein
MTLVKTLRIIFERVYLEFVAYLNDSFAAFFFQPSEIKVIFNFAEVKNFIFSLE